MKKAAYRRRSASDEIKGALKRATFAKKAIINTIPDIAWVKDKEGRYLLVNEAYGAACGVKPEEAVGKTDFDLWDPEIAEMARQGDVMAMESGETKRMREWFVDKAGRTVWVETVKGPMVSDTGDVIGTTGVARDISDRLRMEAEVKESEQRFRDMAELLPNIVYETDLEGRLTFMNRRGLEAFGVPTDICLEEMNISFLKGIAPEERERALQGIRALMSAGTGVRDVEYVMRKHDGTTFPALISVAPIIRDGRAVGARGTITDITQLKKNETALKDSEQRYHDLADLLPNIIYEMDLDGHITFLNRRGIEYFRSPQGVEQGPDPEKKNVNFLQGVAPEERDRAIQSARTLMATGTGVRNSECVMRKYDGTTFPALISAAPIIRDGRTVGLRGTITDVTQLRKSQEALKESQQKYRDLVDLLPETLYEMDASGRLVFVNQRGLECFGYTEEEFKKGINCLQVIVPDDHERARQRIQSVLTDGRVDGNAEFRMVRKDGSIFPALIHGAAIVRDGKPVGIRGIVVDISNLRKSQEALKESQQQYRDLVDLLPEILFENDPSGRITFINQRGLQILGYSERELKEGISCLQVTAPEDRERAMQRLQELLTGSQTHGANEYRVVRKDGSTFLGLIHSAPIMRDGKPVGIRGIVVDIANLKKSEEGRTESEARFRSLAEASLAGVFMINEHLLYDYINPTLAEIFGCTQEEACGGLGPADFIAAEDRDSVMRMAESQLSGQNPHAHFEGKIKRRDGAVRHVEVYGAAAVSNGHPVIVGTLVDITEQKLAEESRKESEEKYRMLMDDASDAIVLVNEDGSIQEVNKSALRLFECGSEELLGKNYALLHKGRESERISEEIAEVFANGYGYMDEFEVVTKQGRTVMTDLTWHILRYAEKWLIQLTFHDISERKQAEASLRESERRYRTMFENTGTANLILEEDGTISLANAEFLNMTGYAKGDIEGKMKWIDFVPHDKGVSGRDQSKLLPDDANGGTYAHQIERFRTAMRCRRGATVDAVVTIGPIPGTTQRICGLVDISQLAHTEKVLKQSEERYRALVEQSSEGIATIDLRTRRVLEANESFLNMLGYGQEEVKELTFYDLLMENKEYIDSAIGRLIRNGRYFVGAQTMRGNKGSTVEVDLATALVRYGDTMHLMVSVRDITDKKQMEETLRQAQKMEAIGTLAGGIAHDLNNILQVVAGFAYQLKSKAGDDPRAARALNEILNASQRGSQLTRNILTFSRKQPVDLQRLAVNDVLSGAQKFLERLIKANIEFRVESPAREVTVMVDRVQIEQILMNLVANANDAMPTGGTLLIRTTVETLTEGFVKSHGYGKPGPYARISVKDTGLGMDEESRKRIFEPFFSTKDASKNTGLGMSVVYGIVKQHNGYITVASQPGAGTTIDVYFPLVAVGEGTRTVAEETGPAGPGARTATGGTETILVAEDQESVRALLRGLLEDEGYTVLEAEDGEKAVELFRAHKDTIDLVVLDLIMPVKDGKQAYDDIKTIRSDIKAIFLSGYSDEVTSDYGMQDGGFILVSKPVLPPALLAKVRDVLGGKRNTEQT